MIKPGKKLYSAIAGAAAVCLLTGGIGYQAVASGTAGQTPEDISATEVREENADGTFSEEGTTQICTVAQMPEFTVDAVTMTVEEVYAEAGNTVSAGDALFKLTDESMEAAKSYYEEAVASAERTLTTAESDLEIGTLEAENARQETELTADSAQESYQAAIDSIDVEVAEKKEAYDEAVDTIGEYQDNLDEGVYYVQAGIDEKQNAVNEAKAAAEAAQQALTEAQQADETAQQTVVSQLSSLQSQIEQNTDYESLLSAVQQAMADYETREQQADSLTAAQQAADTAQSALEKAQMDFDAAVEEYNKNVEEANTKITELTESLEELQEEYEQAQRDAETKKAEAKNTYDTAVVEGNYAQSTYEATVNELQAAVDTAQETLSGLLKEQEALLAMENGTVTASQDGTLAGISYEAEDVLLADTAFAYYYDTDTILISVEVPQEQIARVAVGDEVEVNISGNRQGAVTGTVSSIASSATAGGSISNVTYAVVISIDNSEGRLSSGFSATVTFRETAGGES